MKVGGHRAGRRIGARFLHQMMRGCPVAVAVQQCPADPSVEYAGKGLVVFSRPPLCNHLGALDDTSNAQTLLVGRTAPEAAIVRGIRLLQTFHAREFYRFGCKSQSY